MQTISGFNSKTAKSLLLNVGAFFKNYDVDTDTYATALAAGKLLGATQGGGTFSAVPSITQIPVDSVRGDAKGLALLDNWTVTITANLMEITQKTLLSALAAADVTVGDFYEEVKARNYIDIDTDYIDNITYVGTISGSKKPFIIQVKNAMNVDGLKLTFADKTQGKIPVTFKGHYASDDLDNPPFVILNPKAEGTVSGTVTDTGTPVEGATVEITIDTEDFTATTDSAGKFTIKYVPYGTGYTVTATKGAKTGTKTNVTVVGGEDTAAGAIAIT